MDLLSPTTALGVATFAYKLVKEVRGRLNGIPLNDERRRSIEDKVKVLTDQADELQKLMPNIPPTCADVLQKFSDSLSNCNRICLSLERKSKIKKFISSAEHKQLLFELEDVLSEARQNLQLVNQRVLHSQNQELKAMVEEISTRVEAAAIHPSVGVYMGMTVATECESKKPATLDKPDASIYSEFVVVRWNDDRNQCEHILRYEVRYDDQNCLVVPACLEELRTKDTAFMYSMSLGEPKVFPGKTYTIQIRAVGRHSGPGDWSPAAVLRFVHVNGTPNKPPRPSATVQSPTEVLLTTDGQGDEGTGVHTCTVEYRLSEDPKIPSEQWQSVDFRVLTSTEYRCAVADLQPDSMYSFRVRTVNESGVSPLSRTVEAHTPREIPGPPEKMRVSTKRTNEIIKIRWRPPLVYPGSVDKYEIQQMISKHTVNNWITVQEVTCDSFSATMRDLTTDTKYRFRVRAINSAEDKGNFTEIEAETRYGRAAGTAAALAAFIPSIIGSPLIVSIMSATVAVEAASAIFDSRTGKAVSGATAGIGVGFAGAILGVLGCPFIGIVGAYAAYKRVTGGDVDLNWWSPQSSDEEA